MTTLDGQAVLDRVAAWLAQYLALPSEHCLPAITLWAAHTHTVDAFYVTPRLVLSSAEPGSGKTRVLELLNLITHQPQMIFSPTTAAIFRMMQDGPISLLFDEIDTVFGPKASGNNEDLRALLNAGYKRGATIPRCVGDAAKMSVAHFRVFSPVALAGLAGHMPATILTRAVVIHMRMRPADVKVKPFWERDAEAEAEPLRDELRTWMESQRPTLAHARPVMPEGVEDRPAEVWEALLAIADAAGGRWPELARAACQHFVMAARQGNQSFGVRLLHDLRTVFAGADRMSTTDILSALIALPESPWADLGGKPLDAARLARALKPYEVNPCVYKDNGNSVRGYTTYPVNTAGCVSTGLADAWSRYLPPVRQPHGNDQPEPSNPDPECRSCHQPLFLITPGRDQCAGCEINERQASGEPIGRRT